MIYKRYNIQLAFETPLEPGLQGQLTALEAIVRQIKPKAVKINMGMANEEETTLAVVHDCSHNTTGIHAPCVIRDI